MWLDCRNAFPGPLGTTIAKRIAPNFRSSCLMREQRRIRLPAEEATAGPGGVAARATLYSATTVMVDHG